MRPPAERIARLTVQQVRAMLAAGILDEGAPLELIGGVLLRKDRAATGDDPMTIGPRHTRPFRCWRS